MKLKNSTQQQFHYTFFRAHFHCVFLGTTSPSPFPFPFSFPTFPSPQPAWLEIYSLHAIFFAAFTFVYLVSRISRAFRFHWASPCPAPPRIRLAIRNHVWNEEKILCEIKWKSRCKLAKKKQKHSHYRCLRASTGIYLQVLVPGLVSSSSSSSSSSSVLVSVPAGPVLLACRRGWERACVCQ